MRYNTIHYTRDIPTSPYENQIGRYTASGRYIFYHSKLRVYEPLRLIRKLYSHNIGKITQLMELCNKDQL